MARIQGVESFYFSLFMCYLLIHCFILFKLSPNTPNIKLMRKKRPAKKEKVKKEQSKPVVLPTRNILFFAVLVLLGNAPLLIFSKTILPYSEWMAWLVAGLISLSGLEIVQNGVFLTIAGERWVMTPGCTAITAMVVFVAFVLTYPSSVKGKAIALLVGLPFLLLANITRLFTLAWAVEWSTRYAYWAHDYIWQVVFLMLIALMWQLWIEMVVKREGKTALPA